MSLNPRSIALQGIGFAVVVAALQGIAPVDVQKPTQVVQPGGSVSRAAYEEELDLQIKRQIQEEDEFIISVVAQMIANGALG